MTQSSASRAGSALSPASVRRILFLVGVGIVLLAAWQLLDVLLLAFGAVIVAVVLRSLSEPIEKHTPLGQGSSLAAAGLLIVVLFTGAGWLFGATVSAQVEDLTERLPKTPAEFRAVVGELPMADTIMAQVNGFDLQSAGSAAGPIQSIAGRIGGYAMTVVGALANLLVVIFAGIYLAVHPRAARNGLLALVPRGPREPLAHALDTSGRALSRWLLGQFASMTIVGVLTGLGLWAIGLPSPAALGLFAGIVAFVPVVGPIISVIPAALIALQEGPMMVVWTILVYIVVQQVESNLTYPLIQKKAADLPPALTLFAVLGFGVLFGPLGVVLAAPLMVVLYVLVKILYVRNTLGEETEVPGEKRD